MSVLPIGRAEEAEDGVLRLVGVAKIKRSNGRVYIT